MFVFHEREVVEGGVALGFEGGVTVRTLVSQGCRPVGEPLTITGAEHGLIGDPRGWEFSLPAATAYFQASYSVRDPDGYHYIGGEPILIVEDGVDPVSPVIAPSLA